ncbi:MAG: M20/M25/M40 family metallo-hydrolase [Chloroflexi bacterium]|nr:M20/M25/M40 family metallo-hydrolase [Chloroflexota bacterium]
MSTHVDEQLRAYLREHQARHLERIREFLRQPSFPSDNVGVVEGAELLARYYRELGCQEVEIIPNGDLPGVWASYDAGAPRTLMNYVMFDTKPVAGLPWPTDPLAAEVVEQPQLGRVVIAPGARGRKAPYAQWLNALEALKAVEGELPCNLLFLAEGQENLGSPDYARFFDRYRDRLRHASACFCPGAAQGANGDVSINLGYKGLIYLRIAASGKRMGVGPQGASAHGRTQGLVDSPVWHLLEGLTTLTGDGGRTITVDEFYADHRPPTEEERAEVRALVAAQGERHWIQTLGLGDVKSSQAHLSSEEAYLRFFYDPSFNINGLAAGYVGPGSPVFTLPHEAWALLDVRVPRGWSARRTVERIRAHLARHGFGDLEVEALAVHESYRTPAEDPWVRSVVELIEERGYRVHLVPFTGGGGPWSLPAAEFGVPVLFDVGLGHGGKAGQPGEYLVLDGNERVADLIDCELFYAQMVRRFGEGNS